MPTILGVNFGCEFWGGGGRGPEILEKQGREIRGQKFAIEIR